jgi:hypothetical protein
MKYRELNPFVKGQGIKVQAAAKRYWDNELDSGDIAVVWLYFIDRVCSCGLDLQSYGVSKEMFP